MRFSKKTKKRHIRFLDKHDLRISSISRKTKKFMIGRKLNRRSFRAKIAEGVGDFCRECGCDSIVITTASVDHPELVGTYSCLRCGCKGTVLEGNDNENP